MGKEYLRYFAKYEGHEIPFIELYKFMKKEFGIKDLTRQPSIKMVGFTTDSKEVVEKIKNLEWITEITYNDPIL